MKEQNKDRSIVEAIAEGAEAGIDLLLDNEAVKAIPVVGTIVKIAKGADDYRSRLLLQKLYRFLSEPGLQRPDQAATLRAGILGDEEQRHRIGDTLFLVLDKVTDFEKPALLAKIFVAYLDRQVDAGVFLMLAHAIDQSHLADLLALTGAIAASPGNDEWKARLVSSGLTTAHVMTVGEFNHSYHVYEVNELGKALVRSVEYANKLCAQGPGAGSA